MASTTTPTPTMSDLGQQIREQVGSTIKSAQQISLDAAQSAVKAVSALPTFELPTLPKLPTLTDLPDVAGTSAANIKAATTYTFDVAADLLAAQRDYSVRLAKVLTPSTSA